MQYISLPLLMSGHIPPHICIIVLRLSFHKVFYSQKLNIHHSVFYFQNIFQGVKYTFKNYIQDVGD